MKDFIFLTGTSGIGKTTLADIVDLYNQSRILHDGMWLLIRVDNMETLEAV